MTESDDREVDADRSERREKAKDRRVNGERRGADRVITVEKQRRQTKDRRHDKPDQ